MALLAQEQWYSYADLLEWDEDIRYELYNGVPMAMSCPTNVHQEILGELFWQLENYLRGKPCRAYLSPFDVRLFEKEGDTLENVRTVVQPDLMVVCDRGKVDRRGIRGAPDLVVEILSDSTRRLDRKVKLGLYQKAGVREYWIVDSKYYSITAYRRDNGENHDFQPHIYLPDADIPVGILEGCTINLGEVLVIT